MDSAVTRVTSTNCSSTVTTPNTITSHYSSSYHDQIPDIPASLMIPPQQPSVNSVRDSTFCGSQTTIPASSGM